MKNHSPNNIYTSHVKTSRQSGFSLIEVMIAALILSIGILGVAGLQIVGLKGTQHSFMKQQAMGIVHSLTERMHSNKAGVTLGAYKLDSTNFDCSATPPICSGATSSCSTLEIAQLDKLNLICGYQAGTGKRTGGVQITSASDLATFSGGELRVTCPTSPVTCDTGDVRIEASWSEREYRAGSTGVSGSIVINTRILP